MFPLNFVIIKVNTAIVMVIAILPVRLVPPGIIGTRPNKLFSKIKKNRVSRKGMYILYLLSPIDDLAISSLTKTIIGSSSDCIPLGGLSLFLIYVLAAEINIHSMSNMLKNIAAVFF